MTNPERNRVELLLQIMKDNCDTALHDLNYKDDDVNYDMQSVNELEQFLTEIEIRIKRIREYGV